MSTVLKRLNLVWATLIGTVSFVLGIAVDWDRIAEFELWDPLRGSDNDYAKFVVAKLRNDNNGTHTEDLLRWLEKENKTYHELGRPWYRDMDEVRGAEKRVSILTDSHGLALIGGYVGSTGATLEVWPKYGMGRAAKAVYEGDGTKDLVGIIEGALVDGLQNEVYRSATRIRDDEEYGRLRRMVRQVGQQLSGEREKDDVAFTVAYIENIRADHANGGEKAHQQAVDIYKRLLEGQHTPEEKLPLLANLGIAHIRVARESESASMVSEALEVWRKAEGIASDLGRFEEWAQVRTFQTEADVLIAKFEQDEDRALVAAKRQLETFKDTQGLLSFSTMSTINFWWQEALDATKQSQAKGFVGGKRTQDSTRWSRQEYRRRKGRIEHWIRLFREHGHPLMLAHLVGIRANLLREFGLETNNPGLLVTSFEGSHEFQTRMGIVDPGIGKGELGEIITPQVMQMVEEKAELALACADLSYLKTLASEVKSASVTCAPHIPDHCDDRRYRVRSLLEALDYGIASWGQYPMAPLPQDNQLVPNDDVGVVLWKHAVWLRNVGAKLAGDKSLCPNRLLGIGEDKGSHYLEVAKRTEVMQDLPESGTCVFSPRVSTTAPALPLDVFQIGLWRERVDNWITVVRKQFEEDFKAFKICEGEL